MPTKKATQKPILESTPFDTVKDRFETLEARIALLERLVSGSAQTHSAPKASNDSSESSKGKCLYKGECHDYYYAGQTKFGQRVKLAIDGGKWVPMEQVEFLDGHHAA